MLSGGTTEERAYSFDLKGIFSLVCGIALTLIVSGYQFGRGNHTVYLLDALRELHPELLRNDWFVTHTLQYHAVFSALTALLMKLHIVQPAFLVGYLLLVLLWHIAWRGIVSAVGADERTYLLSIIFYYVSAAGISIGVFQFLQDACFLPSNVANIAMLWGIYQWMLGNRLRAGMWFGVAGLFHVNFAAMTIGLWTVLVAWSWFDRRPTRLRELLGDPILWWSTAIAFVPSLFNLSMAVPAELRHGGTMPMKEFVRVYVRFRHAHHFDPLHWPLGLWLSFLWPIPLAIGVGRGYLGRLRFRFNDALQYARQEMAKVFLVIGGLLIIAFFFAGVWFANEPLVQLCLWRFSIFVKMFSCIGAAGFVVKCLRANVLAALISTVVLISAVLLGVFWMTHEEYHGMVTQTGWSHRIALALAVIALAVIAIDYDLSTSKLSSAFRWIAAPALVFMLVIMWPSLGVGMTPEPEDPNYRAVCAWARHSTPIDAIFLVPPQETDFRLYGQRAIVVNFKHVPQLSGEIVQWQQRLLDVLGINDVAELPQDYTRTMDALESVYENRPATALIAVAEKYDARFIVVDHLLDTDQAAIAFHSSSNPFYVYELFAVEKSK